MPVPLNRFFQTQPCRSRLVCGRCRSSGEDGRRFRTQQHRNWGLPVDFECPYGVPWAPTPKEAQRRRVAVYHALWRELHTAKDADAAWVARFTERIPCGACAAKWAAMLARTPPVFGEGWFRWTWERHEEVNQDLNKPGITYEEAVAIYGR